MKSVRLRPVRPGDCKRLWQWRNERGVRAASFQSTRIAYASHKKWFQKKLRSPKSTILIAEMRNRPVGQLRMESNGQRDAEIHLSVDRSRRAQGIGTVMLKEACVLGFQKLGLRKLRAKVQLENAASFTLFQKAGFHRHRKISKKGKSAVIFTLKAKKDMRQLRVLVVGLGSMGQRHLENLIQMGFKNVSVCDHHPSVLRKISGWNVSTFVNYQKALRAGQDAVIISTPAASHVALAYEALKAGSHVFVEKPLALKLSGLRRLKRLLAQKKKVFQIGYSLRFHPAMMKFKSILKSGSLGKIFSAHLEFGYYLPYWWSWRSYQSSYMTEKRQGGGLLFDASHEIDLVHWFLGEVADVYGVQTKRSDLAMDSADVVKMLLRTKQGVPVSIHLDCVSPEYRRLYRIQGERGTLELRFSGLDLKDIHFHRTRYGKKDGRSQSITLPAPSDSPYRRELEHFFKAIENSLAPAVSLCEAAKIVAVACAMERSQETGKEVKVRFSL